MPTGDLLGHINEYAKLLSKASRWNNSELSIAPVDYRKNNDRGIFYIYEFYCLMRVVNDLCKTYEMEFVKGEGDFEFKFPQAASKKAGKPKFYFKKDNIPVFEIYGGVRIKGKYKSEKDHPDISFLIPNSPDEAEGAHLIMIMDAKYVSDFKRLDKSEADVLESIVRRFNLQDAPRIKIEFSELNGLQGNTLLTNGIFHTDKEDDLDSRLKDNYIKEVQRFFPNSTFEIAGK